MLLLLVDTATATGGVLLARFQDDAHAGSSGTGPLPAEVMGEESLETREFSRQLIPAIDRILQKHHLRLRDLDAFAIVSGPGSFTGLRVGLATVKALAEATAKPVIAVSRLAMMASSAVTCATRPTDASGYDTMIHAVLDAGRGTFSHGVYRNAGRTCVSESFEAAAALAESLIRHPSVVAASEPAVLALLHGTPGVIPRAIPEVSVRQALPLVLNAWRTQNFADVALLDAQYLRRMNPGIEPQATGPVPTPKS